MHHISKELDFIGITLFPFFFAAAVSSVFVPVIADASAVPSSQLQPKTSTSTSTSKSTLKKENIEGFVAKPPIHVLAKTSSSPKGLSPDQVKEAYRLPKSGGSGTIAIITAYDSPTIESDLGAFNTQFKLASCTVANTCLEIHKMSTKMKQSAGWAMETALDTEWAHAMAPGAKILVVEANSSSGPDLLKAVDYARKRPDVTSVSMSWGGSEFKNETSLDSHFTSDHGIAFFGASGDNGAGTSWPAVSPNVVAVGGTSLVFDKNGAYVSEKAWSGSGGGVSLYETEPGYQKSYSIAKANGKRAIPDVSFNADPTVGYSVYHKALSARSSKTNSWFIVGGTSAGTPQWAGIKALDSEKNGIGATSTISYLTQLYEDKASTNHSKLFRDITSGSNGVCGYYCDARKHFDYVTGLGTPIAYRF